MAARKRLGGQVLGAATTTGWAPFLGAATTQMAPNPLRPLGCRGTAPPAVLSLLDDAQRHRRRRDALHPGPWRWQRDLRAFFSSLLALGVLRELVHHLVDGALLLGRQMPAGFEEEEAQQVAEPPGEGAPTRSPPRPATTPKPCCSNGKNPPSRSEFISKSRYV